VLSHSGGGLGGKFGVPQKDINRAENFLTVRVRVQGAQAPWICEHSTREVMRVYYDSAG
jgi:hypothetical protein